MDDKPHGTRSNDLLFKQILPQMHELGRKVISLAFEAAKEQQAAMLSTRENIIWLLIGAAVASVSYSVSSSPMRSADR